MTEINYTELCSRFDDLFNDCNPDIEFGCLIYLPSLVLKKVDPIAYREEVLCFIDQLLTDGKIYEHSDGTYHDEPEQSDEDTIEQHC